MKNVIKKRFEQLEGQDKIEHKSYPMHIMKLNKIQFSMLTCYFSIQQSFENILAVVFSNSIRIYVCIAHFILVQTFFFIVLSNAKQG